MSHKTVAKHACREYGCGELSFWDKIFSETTENNTNEQ